MKEDENSFTTNTQNLLHIFLILGGFSAVLFFIGQLNYNFYYGILGVNSKFFDFQYYDYVSNGFIESLFLIFASISFIPIYHPFYELSKTRKQLATIKNQVLNSNDPVLKKKA